MILSGCALGDAIGWPFEFLSESDIQQSYRDITQPMSTFAEEYTDDTQMSLVAARLVFILNRSRDIPIYDLMVQFYGAWERSQQIPGQSRAPGLTVMRSLRDKTGDIAHRYNNSKGNGTVMRAGPYGLMTELHDAIGFSIEDAFFTHGHILAPYTSAIHAAINWYLLNSVYTINDCIISAQRVVFEYFNSLRKLGLITNRDIEEITKFNDEFYDVISRDFATPVSYRSYVIASRGGGTADTTLLLAVLALLEYSHDFDAAMRFLVLCSGDSDTYAAVFGSMYGAATRRHRDGLERTDPAPLQAVVQLTEYANIMKVVDLFDQ